VSLRTSDAIDITDWREPSKTTRRMRSGRGVSKNGSSTHPKGI